MLPLSTEREESISKNMQKAKFGLFMLCHSTAIIPRQSICNVTGDKRQGSFTFPPWSSGHCIMAKKHSNLFLVHCYLSSVLIAVLKHPEITF